MKEKKVPENGKFEFSASLARVSAQGRIAAGFTQNAVAAQTGVDKRTIIYMENGEGNPTLEKLYPVIRLYGADPRPIFYPELALDTPSRQNLRFLLETCSEREAVALIPIVRAVLNALRAKADDGKDLMCNT